MSTYDPYWNNVTLLCNFDNGYTDSAKNHQFVPIGDSYVGTSAAQYKSGGSSLLSTSRAYGQAGYVRCTDVNSDFHFQGEMTIEFFFYTPDLVTNGSILGFGNNLIYGGTALNTNRVAVAIYNNNIFLYLDHGTPTAIFNSITLYNNLILANSWNHIAITRDSSNIVRLFANGQLSQPNPLLANPSVSNPYNRDMIEYIDSFCIGSMELYGTTILGAGGYIDSVRITKGICRYSEPFTPPTGDFDQFPKQLIIEDSSGNIVHTKSLEGLTSGTYKLPYSIGASTWEGKLKVYTTGMYPNLTKIMDVSCISNDNCDPYWDNVVLAMHMDGVPPGAYNVVSGTYTPPGIYNSVEDIRVQVTNFIRNANGCQPSADWSGCPTISGSSQLIPVIYDNSDGTGTINFTGYYGGPVSVSYNNNIFIDEKGHSITRVGNTKISTDQSKFGGASAYFDGNGDRLSITSTALGAGDFTIELYFKTDSIASGYAVLCHIQTGVAGFYRHGNRVVWYEASGDRCISSAIITDKWYHAVVTRKNNSISVYLDGITSTTTYASSYNYTSTNYNIGLHPNNIEPFVGYIDDLRITKGIARYTENFEPPTKAFPNTKCTNIVGNYDPYWDNVVLLMHFDEDKVYHVSGFGSNNWHLTKELACSLGTIEAYVGNKYGRHNSTNNTCQVYNDSSYTTLYTTWTYAEEPALIDVKGHYVSDEPGNTAISSTIKKFGDRSLFSNAKVGQLMGSTSTDYAFGTGDFTIEAWVYLVSATQDIRIWQPTSGEVIPAEIQSSSRRLSAYYGGAIGAVGTPVPLNTWSHIAYFRRDGVLSAALNGIVQWSGALTYNFTAVNWCTYTNSTANTFYMDELRITKGVARYSGNFTVPSTPFQESTSITTTTKYQELNWSVGQPTMNLAQDLNWVIGPNSYHLPGDLNWSTYPIQSATQELAWATRPLIEKNVDIYYAIAPTIKQELQWDISPTIRQDLNWAIGYQVKKEINWSIRQWNTQDVSWEVE